MTIQEKDTDLYVEDQGGETNRHSPLSSLRFARKASDIGGPRFNVGAEVSEEGLHREPPREVSKGSGLTLSKDEPKPRLTVLEEAEEAVSGPRRSAYGHPRDNLAQTAELFSSFLKRKLTEPITAEEVCWLLVMLKASRESFAHSRDNLVDAVGYLRCAELISE